MAKTLLKINKALLLMERLSSLDKYYNHTNVYANNDITDVVYCPKLEFFDEKAFLEKLNKDVKAFDIEIEQ